MSEEVYNTKNENFIEIYNKPPLFVAIKSTGSFISLQYQLTKNIYTISKNFLPLNTSIKMLHKYMLNTKERNSLYTQLKLYKIIE